MVYPAWGDGEGEFVVEDCLEGGDNLGGVKKYRNDEMMRLERVQNIGDKCV